MCKLLTNQLLDLAPDSQSCHQRQLDIFNVINHFMGSLMKYADIKYRQKRGLRKNFKLLLHEQLRDKKQIYTAYTFNFDISKNST